MWLASRDSTVCHWILVKETTQRFRTVAAENQVWRCQQTANLQRWPWGSSAHSSRLQGLVKWPLCYTGTSVVCSIYDEGCNSELGTTSHISWQCSICKSEKPDWHMMIWLSLALLANTSIWHDIWHSMIFWEQKNNICTGGLVPYCNSQLSLNVDKWGSLIDLRTRGCWGPSDILTWNSNFKGIFLMT